MICPFCNSAAVNITIHGDTGPDKYLCVGIPPHEFREGDGPPEPEPSDIDIDRLAEAIAVRVVDRLNQKRPGLFHRIIASLK